MSVPEITVQELEALRNAGADHLLLDVRNPDEVAICHLGGMLIPYGELATRFHELNPNQHIIIHCHAGGRSARATAFLLAQGFIRRYKICVAVSLPGRMRLIRRWRSIN